MNLKAICLGFSTWSYSCWDCPDKSRVFQNILCKNLALSPNWLKHNLELDCYLDCVEGAVCVLWEILISPFQVLVYLDILAKMTGDCYICCQIENITGKRLLYQQAWSLVKLVSVSELQPPISPLSIKMIKHGKANVLSLANCCQGLCGHVLWPGGEKKPFCALSSISMESCYFDTKIPTAFVPLKC